MAKEADDYTWDDGDRFDHSPLRDPTTDDEENEIDSGIHESAVKAQRNLIHKSFPRPQNPDGSEYR